MSTQSPSASSCMLRLLLALMLWWLMAALLTESGLVQSAPLTPRESSANTRFFRNLIYSGVGFNRTMMYHKDEITPDLVKMLRKDPDSVSDPPPLNITLES